MGGVDAAQRVVLQLAVAGNAQRQDQIDLRLPGAQFVLDVLQTDQPQFLLLLGEDIELAVDGQRRPEEEAAAQLGDGLLGVGIEVIVIPHALAAGGQVVGHETVPRDRVHDVLRPAELVRLAGENHPCAVIGRLGHGQVGDGIGEVAVDAERADGGVLEEDAGPLAGLLVIADIGLLPLLEGALPAAVHHPFQAAVDGGNTRSASR